MLHRTLKRFCLTLQSSRHNIDSQVALNYGQFIGDATDYTLLDFFVYDGDNLNTANMIGSLADVDYYMTFSTGKNLSIVNFYGDGSSSYALGNDASTISSFSLYFLYMTRVQTGITGTLAGTTTNGAAYTFICVDCSTFYWTRLQFDSMVNGNVTNVAFQGMTPTHKKEKLLRYEFVLDIFKLFLFGPVLKSDQSTS